MAIAARHFPPVLLLIGLCAGPAIGQQHVHAGSFAGAADSIVLMIDPSDFGDFAYSTHIAEEIGYHWFSSMTGANANPMVRFSVERSGQITGVELERSSGVFAIDRDALEVLRKAALPPLPPWFSGPRLTVHVIFSPRRFSGPLDSTLEYSICEQALRHLIGWGVPRDLRKAIELYQRAADVGSLRAMNDLGFLYENGEGVPRDEAAAAAWYRKAAERGSGSAQISLALMYEQGRGVKADDREALLWYRIAARSSKAEVVRQARQGMERLSQ
jgi:TonB family protein